MPNRLLKEGICTSDTINSLSSDSEVLLYRLLVVSDDYGRMDARLAIIKSACFPLKDSMTQSKIDKLLQELSSSNLIQLYFSEGKPYLFIKKWNQRQRSIAKYPDPELCNEIKDDTTLSASRGQESAECGSGLGLGLGLGLGSGVGKGSSVDEIPPCPIQKIVDLYHECMPDNPRVIKLDLDRKKAIKARWEESAKGFDGNTFSYKTVEEGLSKWRNYFETCAQSVFLTGKSPPREGSSKPFIADIDFLFHKKRFINILEYKYHS